MKLPKQTVLLIILCFLAAGLVISSIFWMIFRDSPERRIQRTENALADGNYQYAIELITPLLEEKDHADRAEKLLHEAYYEKGKSFFIHDKMHEARGILLNIPGDSEWYIPSLTYLVQSKAGLQQWRRVWEILENYFPKIELDEVEIQLLKGRANYYLDRKDHAMEIFTQILDNNPAHLEALQYQALIYARRNLLDAALSCVEKALQHVPESRNWLLFQAVLLAEKEKNSEALKVLDTILEKSPDDVRAAFLWLMLARNDIQADQERIQRYLNLVERKELFGDMSFFIAPLFSNGNDKEL